MKYWPIISDNEILCLPEVEIRAPADVIIWGETQNLREIS